MMTTNQPTELPGCADEALMDEAELQALITLDVADATSEVGGAC